MKIVAISDTHTLHHRLKLPKADMLIHAGDACIFGNQAEFQDFAKWMRVQPFEYKVYVPGNHDRFVEQQPDVARQMLGDDVKMLIDEETEMGGFSIYGMPWTPEFRNWAFNATVEQRRIKCGLIPEELDILVTHGPPLHVGDKLPLGGEIGCQQLWIRFGEMITAGTNPSFHVFGHCHNSYGIYKGFHTIHMNVAQCDESYKIGGQPPMLFHI